MLTRVLKAQPLSQLAHVIRAQSTNIVPTGDKINVEVSTVADAQDANRLTRLSGFSQVEQTRKVKIFIPAKNVMQSGTHGKDRWRLKWDTQERYENPLMGWASSCDPLSNLHLSFPNPESAISYCVKHGFEYEVVQPKKVSKKRKVYGDNFAWSSHSRVVAK
ncbi:hypothetical protein ACHWQZ_G010487 [Mnemiopsis leidyi]